MARTSIISVVLEKEKKDEDCEQIIAAIEMIRGVLKAEIVESDHTAWAAREQARFELVGQMEDILWPKP